ncbi:MAG TPA: cytochrome P450, partial [Burkholderiaceae bacterium]|nr:cytochrome P450 [Burkholderiaceae bacterium]
MSNRVPVARIAALPDDTPVAARIAGVDLTVVNHAGRITVCQGRCPHQGTLLAEGTIEKGALVCRGHGWRFDCASGAKIDDPRVCLKHFAVFLTDGVVQVDPQEVVGWQAAQAPVAAAHPHGRPRWIADLPGPKGLPWLGQVLSWKPRQLHLIGERWCREYGPLYSFKLMSRPVVAVAEPQLLTQILRERPERYRRLKVLEAVLHEIG